MATTTTHTRSNSKLHHGQFYSRGTVPFSWENKPGVSKLPHSKTEPKTEYYFFRDDDYKLPPPPRVSFRSDYQLPLPPPCTFQQSISRNSSMKALISNKPDTEDPFQVAILECTKSINKGGSIGGGEAVAGKGKVKTPLSSSPSPKYNGGFGSGVRSLFESLSCKRSSSVRDDSLVKVSRVPYHTDTELNN